MRLVTAHRTTRKTKKAGRHAAPPDVKKMVLRAGMVSVAAAAVGGLATAPLLGNSAAPASAAAIGGLNRTDQALPWQAQAGHAARTTAGAARSRSATKAGDLAGRHGAGRHGAGRHGAGRHGAAGARRGARPAGSPGRRRAARGHASLRCSGSGGMLPANYATIVGFLIRHGYTGLAAAGVAGNIYQESKGNPESVGTGGGGLIGWTPLPAGFVTGNPAADLRTELAAILTYDQQWSQYIPMLDAAGSAKQAADIYMNYFERPGLPMAANREAAAVAVASACGL